MDTVGAEIVAILEQAGAQYLKQNEPDLYQAYLLNVGATEALRRYDGSETYWDRIQAILDAFFSSGERAAICAQIIARGELWHRPEFRAFLMHAIAERRLQSVLAEAPIGSGMRLNVRPAAARRAG